MLKTYIIIIFIIIIIIIIILPADWVSFFHVFVRWTNY